MLLYNFQIQKIFRKRLVAIGIALIFMILAMATLGRPVLADILGLSTSQVEDFATVNLQTTVINGYQQVYYKSDGRKVILSKGHLNHTNPFGRGKFAVWQTEVNGAPQIELYDAAADKYVKVTRMGTNQNPRVNASGQVVWEQWVEDRWQVMFYDGSSKQQITNGDVAVRPDINGSLIIYATQDSAGSWKTKRYNVENKHTETIKDGAEAAYPYFNKDKVKFGFLPQG